jgi:hypothetical protein
MISKGITLRNAGLIERARKFKWVGEETPSRHKKYCTFQTAEYGLRAIMKLLINYGQKHSAKTYKDALLLWGFDAGQIRAAAKYAGLSLNEEYKDFTDVNFLISACKGIVLTVNGHPKDILGERYIEDGVTYYWYAEETYKNAYEVAVKGRLVSHSHNELHDDIFKNLKLEKGWKTKLKSFIMKI